MQRDRLRRWIPLVLLTLAACGGDDGPTPPPATGNFTIALSSGALALVSGGSPGTVNVNVARTGNFSGAVNLTVEGAPTGLTATITPAQVATGATQATVSVTAATAVAAGTYPLTIRGAATGLTAQTATLTVTVTTPPPASIALAVSSAGTTLAPGDNSTFNATVTRTNYTGTVTVAVSNVPTGVTANVQSTGDTHAITISVGATATPGAYPLTITASGTGVTSQTATYNLTVSPPPSSSIAVALNPTSATVQQGQSTTVTATLTRTNFPGNVTLNLVGAPAGVTPTITGSPTTTNTITVQLAVGAAVTPGPYQINFNAAGTGVTTAITPFTLTVTTPPTGSGNVTYSFGFCPADERPIWVAAQDGSGAWQQVVGSNNTYSFNIGTRGGLAFVTQNAANDFDITFYYGTLGELQVNATDLCPTASTKTVSGSVAGLNPTGGQAMVTLGGAVALVSAPQTTFTLNEVPSGTVDLIAARSALNLQNPLAGLVTDKLIIRRGLNPAAGSTLPVLDFNAAEAFDPDSRALTVTGAAAGEQVFATTAYATSGQGSASLSTSILSGATGTYSAVPAARQATGDLHILSVFATQAGTGTATSTRGVARVFKDAVAQTLALGPAFNTPTFTSLATTPYARTRAQLATQAQYNGLWALGYSQSGAASRAVTVIMTQGYLGAGAFDFSFPDFTMVSGWQNTWGPTAGVQAEYVVSASGWTLGGTANNPYTEGTTVLTGARSGTFTP